MRQMVLLLSSLLLLNQGPALADDQSLRQKAVQAGLAPLPAEAPASPDNPITPTKVQLGKRLFFEPRLSASGLISCNTCHNLGMGGDDNLPTSVGHGWHKGPRNAPTVYNAVFNRAQFWDGRAKDLEQQAKGPIQAAVEMANSPEQVVAALKSMPEYVAWFREAFPDDPEPVSFDNVVKAIAAFESKLITPESAFDRFMNGDDAALTAEQQEGLGLFIDRGCTACHNGVNIGGQAYFPFGLIKRPGADILPPEDKGRFAITQSASDEYVFRAAPLRNVALTAPYFHSGQVWDLKQAVLVMGSAQLGVELSDEEAAKIADFLRSLTGVVPEIIYPQLPVESADTPRPQP